jgi:hypothetical protein
LDSWLDLWLLSMPGSGGVRGQIQIGKPVAADSAN